MQFLKQEAKERSWLSDVQWWTQLKVVICQEPAWKGEDGRKLTCEWPRPRRSERKQKEEKLLKLPVVDEGWLHQGAEERSLSSDNDHVSLLMRCCGFGSWLPHPIIRKSWLWSKHDMSFPCHSHFIIKTSLELSWRIPAMTTIFKCDFLKAWI